MPNDENQYLLNSELEVENETLKFVYFPLIRRVAEFNVKWSNNVRIFAQHLQEPYDGFAFPIERDSRQYGINYNGNVQFTANSTDQSFALSIKHATVDASHKFAFDLAASTWGLDNFSFGYAFSRSNQASLGTYYNSKYKSYGLFMWHGLFRDMGEYQQKSMIVCNFERKKDKTEAILAGSYSYEDMTDPNSKPRELWGKLTSEGNLELSVGV